MLNLRDYQQDCVDRVWEQMFYKKNILVSMPCGAGKTECFIELCRRAVEYNPDIKILIILNRVQLVEQTARRISKVIDNCAIYCGSLNKKEIKNITVASVQSVFNKDFDKINLVILDECHHLTDNEDSQYRVLLKNLDHEKLKTVGFTATPYNNDGYIYGEKKFFEEIDFKVDLVTLIEEKYLVKPSMKGTENGFDTSKLKIVGGDFDKKQISEMVEDELKTYQQVQDALLRSEGRKKIGWMCATIKHAEIVYSNLNNAVVIHSKQPKETQDYFKNEFEKGSARHLVFVSMFTEGVDIPCIDAIVLLRPTKSPVLYVQAVGRSLRLFEGKSDALVLDYGEVIKNCGPLTAPIIRKKGQRRATEELYDFKICKKCFEIIESLPCPACGYEEPKKVVPKLTKEPEREADLLGTGNKRLSMEVRDIVISQHKSKNGNNCLRMKYLPKSFLHEVVEEYFMMDSNWGQQRAANRMTELDISFTSDLSVLLTRKAQRVPKRIEYEKDGRFFKVKRLYFV